MEFFTSHNHDQGSNFYVNSVLYLLHHFPSIAFNDAPAVSFLVF